MIFSVIIPTYNRFNKLKDVLVSLENQDFDEQLFEVIVIDDGSTDLNYKNFVELSLEYKKLNLVLLKQKNFGAGAARNKGIKTARGKYLIFLGDDTMAEKNLLTEHLTLHRKFPGSCILGFVDWDKKLKLNKVMETIAPFGHQFDYNIKNPLDCGYKHFYTSNISLEKKILGNYLFRSEFIGCNWEDVDIGFKLSKKGVKIIYNSKAICYHNHYYDEESFLKRQRSVGTNKYIFLKINPELNNIWSSRYFLKTFLLFLNIKILLGKLFGGRKFYLKALFSKEMVVSFLNAQKDQN